MSLGLVTLEIGIKLIEPLEDKQKRGLVWLIICIFIITTVLSLMIMPFNHHSHKTTTNLAIWSAGGLAIVCEIGGEDHNNLCASLISNVFAILFTNSLVFTQLIHCVYQIICSFVNYAAIWNRYDHVCS